MMKSSQLCYEVINESRILIGRGILLGHVGCIVENFRFVLWL